MFFEPLEQRCFLFLQGPHGPFASRLAVQLRESGHRVCRINFNGGDKIDWSLEEATDFTGGIRQWTVFLRSYIQDRGVTDIVFYGYWRPVHRIAIQLARRLGLRVHGLEEGLLRPHWVTLSPLKPCEQAHMLERAVATRLENMRLPPLTDEERHRRHDVPSYAHAHNWMLLRCLAYYTGYLLHWRRFRHYRTHRPYAPSREMLSWCLQLVCYPWRKWSSERLLARLDVDSRPFFLLCLQLDGDSQIQRYSPLKSMVGVMEEVLASFAQKAPADMRMIIKAHPLDNDTGRLLRAYHRIVEAQGLSGRVDFVGFGKLAGLLRRAQGLVTVNSSTGLSSLYHGCPVKTMGLAVYNIDGLADVQAIDAFWQQPQQPRAEVYDALFEVLTSVSQHPGGFYVPAAIDAAVKACLPLLELQNPVNTNVAADAAGHTQAWAAQ